MWWSLVIFLLLGCGKLACQWCGKITWTTGGTRTRNPRLTLSLLTRLQWIDIGGRCLIHWATVATHFSFVPDVHLSPTICLYFSMYIYFSFEKHIAANPHQNSYLHRSRKSYICIMKNSHGKAFPLKITLKYTFVRIGGSVVECSPATRATRVRFPADARF